jgi:hypothetical protein
MEHRRSSPNSARYDFTLVGKAKKHRSEEYFAHFGDLSADIEKFVRESHRQSFWNGDVDCRCVAKIEEMTLETSIRYYLGFNQMCCSFFARMKDASTNIPVETCQQIATGGIARAIIHHTAAFLHHSARNVRANDPVRAI